MKNNIIIKNIGLNKILGFDKLISKSNGVYLVGGIVRDFYLQKPSKDIDILVCGLYYEEIINILKPYGIIKEVGKSFGILKFLPNNWNGDDIDIAIPRTEVKNGSGHTEFEIKTDPFLPIEEELNRRDFTINSIAISLDGTIIDPFNGLDDIAKKIIRATSNQAFSEDPLRMCRAIQFASRFKFDISQETWDMIINNKSDIKTISGERILEELDKIFYKGDIKLGLELFKNSGLHGELFNTSMICDLYSDIKTRADFYFTICTSSLNYTKILKGGKKKTSDIIEKTSKDIKAIEKCFELKYGSTKFDIRKKLFEAIQISSNVLDCGRIPFYFKDVIEDYKSGKYPKTYKELTINGDDLINLGYSGKEIGDKF